MRNSTIVSFLFVLHILSIGFVPAQSLPPRAFANVNSALDEQAPVISPDGRTLYFTVAHHPQNIAGKRDPGDVWISSLQDDGTWSAPVHGGPVLNNTTYNAILGFSRDGSRIFLTGHYSTTGMVSTQGIAASTKTNSGWTAPENIGIPYFFNRSEVLHGYVSADGLTFVFSAESRETLGVEDIYVTTKDESGKWSEPRNLKSRINTRFQELSPSLSEDGRTLFFASNGWAGMGSYDLYSTERLDDTWTNWSEPINLGSMVNSGGRDLFYRPYPSRGFAIYTSTNNSDGYGDIKMLQIKVDSLAASSNEKLFVKSSTADSEDGVDGNQFRVFGRVTSGNTNLPVDAVIHYQSDTVSRRTLCDSDGKYEAGIPLEREYVIKVEAPGYVATMERLNLSAFKVKELEMNFKLQPIAVGATINLKNVLFQQGESSLLPESSDELDMVVAFMNANPKVIIELGGHTDNRGIHVHNMRLSKERVDKVKEYLVAKGVLPERIIGKGYGGTRPIASNDAEDTRKLNRRVEFTIVAN